MAIQAYTPRKSITSEASERAVIASEHDGAAAIRIAEDAMKALVRYDWPGNIRQLQNVLERAALTSDQELLEADKLRQALASESAITIPANRQSNPPPSDPTIIPRVPRPAMIPRARPRF